MATVSTETIYCFHQEFKRVVRYKSRCQKFYITLPGGVPEKEVSAKTEADAIKLFNAAVKVYEESVTETTKVILYGYEVDAYIYGPNDEDDRVTVLFNSQDNCDFGKTFTDDGITLSLWVQVCEKSEVVLEGMDNYVTYEEIESPVPESLEPSHRTYRRGYDDFQEIPWTPENEQFFVDAGLALERLILKLNSVFGEKKGVLEFIAAGQKLLPEVPTVQS